MRRKIKLLAAAFAGVALAATSATAAVASTSSSSPRPATVPAVSRIVAEVTYGIANGKPFVHVLKGQIVGTYKLSEITAIPAAAALCTEYISDVSKANGNQPFKWETAQVCTGSFGDQYMATTMMRSSYSGPRAYGSKRFSDTTSKSTINVNWSLACHYGTGEYNYFPEMYGYATGAGQGPTIRSDNTLEDAHCGTTP
jgi:hypothetical protein